MNMGIKHDVDENFFNEWNSPMAYVLGYLYADGSMENTPYNRGKYFRVGSVDKSTIIKIKTWLNSNHKITKRPTMWPGGSSLYVLRIGSHKIYNDLEQLGLYPHKSLSVPFPDIPKKYINDFVRGYFDGDGCVNLWMSKGKIQKQIVRKLSIIFSSGSKEFLSGLSRSLEQHVNLRHKKTYNTRGCFQLRYSTHDSIKLFEFLYKDIPKELYLTRKLEIFAKYFKLRPVRVTDGIRGILKTCG